MQPRKGHEQPNRAMITLLDSGRASEFLQKLRHTAEIVGQQQGQILTQSSPVRSATSRCPLVIGAYKPASALGPSWRSIG